MRQYKNHTRKGINPVCASIILIAVTIGIGVTIAGFIFVLFGTYSAGPIILDEYDDYCRGFGYDYAASAKTTSLDGVELIGCINEIYYAPARKIIVEEDYIPIDAPTACKMIPDLCHPVELVEGDTIKFN